MSDMEELKKIGAATWRTLNDLRNARNNEINERCDAIKREVNAKYADRIKAAAEAETAANKAIEAERERLALAAPQYPIGTRFELWKNPNRWLSGSAKPSGEFGIFEIITSASKHPANAASYSRASIGTPVIRPLKKDGTPGLKYEQFHEHSSWKPVAYSEKKP